MKTGAYVASVGSKGSAPPHFSYPVAMALHPSGQAFVIDREENTCVRVLNPDLSFSHTFGGDIIGSVQFDDPVDIACDSQGMVYVADSANDRVQKFHGQPNGELVTTFDNQGGAVGEIDEPFCIAIDNMDCVYVADENNRISVFTSELKFMYCFGCYGSEDGNFDEPTGLAFDQSGHLYVCDSANHRIVIFQ